MFEAIQGTILVFLCSLGVSINLFCIFSFFKLSAFKNAFGYLSANQAIADALYSSLYLFYFCFRDFLDVLLFQDNVFIFGFLVAFSYDVSVLTHFVISLNRFISVWCPIFYKTMFNLKYTKLLIFAVWLFSFLIGSFFHIVLCRIWFDADLILFTIILTPSYCFEIGRYGDLLRNSCIVIIMMILDVFTLIKVKFISNKIKKSVSEQAVQQFTSRDRRFLAQAVTQGSLFLLATMAFFLAIRFPVHPWVTFLGKTFSWAAIHVADGLILILFNPEIKKLICNGSQVSTGVLTAS